MNVFIFNFLKTKKLQANFLNLKKLSKEKYAGQLCVYVYIYIYIYLPTPPLGQDMTQGQLLSESLTGFEFRFFLLLD